MLHNEDREYMDALMHGLKAEMKAGFDMLGYKNDEIIAHQKKTNGRVTNLEENTKMLTPIWKNRKLIVIGLMVVWFLLAMINDNTNLSKTLAQWFGIVPKTEQTQ